MGGISCPPEGEGRDLPLSQKVDEMMTMLQTMRMETAEMKNMLFDTRNKNNKENDDEEEEEEEATMMRSERINCRRQEERRNLSEEVDELRTEFQTMRSEIAEMKNMLLADALNKNNNKENDDEQPVQSNFVFGASTPAAASPFQFGIGSQQQNIAPQNPSPFQASGSLEFNAGWSFSLGTGGGDKSGRKFVKVKHKQRKK